jgi:hypothetical protein
VSMINLALDGLPIHPDGISGEQAISIPWDYVSLGLSVIVKEKDLMRKKLFRFYIKGDREELLETSSHAFTFPALSPGNYELWVSYSKKNGDWSVPLRLLSPKSSVKIQKTFFYTLQALYFGRFSVFAEQWVIYNYASILEVFTIISIAVFSVFNRVSLCSS